MVFVFVFVLLDRRSLAALSALHKQTRQLFRTPAILTALVAAGFKGDKSGGGFFVKGKPNPVRCRPKSLKCRGCLLEPTRTNIRQQFIKEWLSKNKK